MSSAAMQQAFGWADQSTSESYVNAAAATKEQMSVLTDVLN